ncbi:phage tail assembly chaperone [Veillonella intestinalis]|uniref:phage tail assembly chaperone n=1 Tax=Veillonella intestinalis TaxID=2941341 RepID=UPI002040B027|nr:hypothetical protein [Veillonella intestinalis]
MAINIKELIAKKEELEAKKSIKYDLVTSIGTITVAKPSESLVAEALDLSDGSDEYLIINSVVEPNLKDKELLEAFNCASPFDIVGKLFDGGEIVAISKAIMKTAGYGTQIEAKVHETVKN